MPDTLPIGSRVLIQPPFTGEDPTLPYVIYDVQWITLDGLITETEQPHFQYLVKPEANPDKEPSAFLPEYVLEISSDPGI